MLMACIITIKGKISPKTYLNLIFLPLAFLGMSILPIVINFGASAEQSLIYFQVFQTTMCVIIFNEPTAYLDPKHCRILLETLDLLHQSGKQIILSTHDVNLAYSWADNILIVKDGKLLESGAPEEIFENDEILNRADLQKPMLLEVYQILFEKGLIGKRQAKSIEELRCIL
ncbi:conserved exported protein of unknown function [Tepidanaerobacter acetatoxydans Re1]|uniref:ABC transporter related protein n=1 Tax=Tepidanaerobacter acetatoxydans (strain DSM 21804 / JCM 16047 / Re1) TaxID=1209989 RepID=F4LUS9_TEPAE|nr:hypothetical protein [Tepidanaerobacter acetatoxydans]AEE90647.1 hypothetical protein TepRe1_0449 [Tepidanaerobacter acetatoxydans Re1]CDI40395.1 conserved exported protein of unknown function [Tepidanaerobacter acetatoxydans Re1]